MIGFARRASTVLFNLLSSRRDDRPYLLPANACPILLLTLLKAGARFELIDVAADSLCMDANEVMKRVRGDRRGYAGLVFVRTYGALIDAAQLFADVKRVVPEALIIDDRCLCRPEFPDAVPDGADAVLYSTGYAKHVDLGWGGYGIFADHVEYRDHPGAFDADALDRLTTQYKASIAAGGRFRYQDGDWLDRRPPVVGWEEYQVSVREELAKVAATKRAINTIYQSGISPRLQLADPFQSWRFNLLIANASEVLESIFSAGLFASRHYASLAGIFSEGDAPYARMLHTHVVNLFNDRYFDETRARQMVEIIRQVAKPVASSGNPIAELIRSPVSRKPPAGAG